MRIGKFYISDYLVEQLSDQVAQAFFEVKFIPLRVEYLWSKGSFLMEGFSPKFSEVKEGEEIPFYNIIVNDLQEGKISVSIEEVKEGTVK